ncbi:MAG: UDP-N-acetylglucosamine 2-epimerase (non-hydrolyzing) [Alphaproteobacteria bacterium]|nr:MAG: UDP-N-acetylglucosamine 2-epimerase (non-hydrolyzing) [Alphaproteobacteria bacterium]
MKILTIIGARPQFIKAAAVSREIAKHSEITEILVHTGQHYDTNMSDIFFEQMSIPKPQYHLDIAGLSHGAMTGRMLEKIEAVLLKERPDWVMVYGDTNSTLAGALAAAKLHIPVAHVEAGLRSFNMKMPEEINRILTDRISSLLLCPTSTAVQNLKLEGYDKIGSRVVICGDVMQDAVFFYSDKEQCPGDVMGIDLNEYFILATIHRAENTDDPARLSNIASALSEINHSIPVLLPLHPRTRAKLQEYGIELDATVIDPVGYLEMIYLLKRCRMVMSDSGGLQKEAYFFLKPCITLREETEWVELIHGGYNMLAGSDKTKIINSFHSMLNRSIVDQDNLYGGGDASSKIVVELLK